MTKTSFILLISTLLLTACGQRTSEKIDLEDVEIAKIQISAETMVDIIQNIASPVEVASLINSLHIPFSSSNLPNPKILSAEGNPLDLAYHLGILYSDFAYINIYEQTGLVERFLTSIDELTTTLHIGQYFDLATIRRMSASGSSMDSLMYISINSFNQMGNYLRESNHGDQSALLIAGAWMEGLYLATQATLQNDNEHLRNMIGDQKLILNDLLLVLNFYNSESLMKAYIADLEKIMSFYDEVEIISVVGDPEPTEKDGMLEMVQSETSQLLMSDEVLDQITEATAEVRNSHLNIKTQVK